MFVSPLGLPISVIRFSDLTAALILADPGVPSFPVCNVTSCSWMNSGVESGRYDALSFRLRLFDMPLCTSCGCCSGFLWVSCWLVGGSVAVLVLRVVCVTADCCCSIGNEDFTTPVSGEAMWVAGSSLGVRDSCLIHVLPLFQVITRASLESLPRNVVFLRIPIQIRHSES